MKKILAGILVAILSVLMYGSVALASDGGVEIEVIVVGDDPTVVVEANGEGATIYINGRNINYPEIYVDFVESAYDDSALRDKIASLTALLDSYNYDLTVTSDGVAKIILTIKAHAESLIAIVNKVNQVQEDSVLRDNDILDKLGMVQEEHNVATTVLEAELLQERTDTDNAIATIQDDYQTKFAVGVASLGGVILVLSALCAMMYRKVCNLT